MLIDAFLFCGEFDLLNIRLQELKERVDRFILVESNRTFSGQKREFSFYRKVGDYQDWPIDYIQVDGSQASSNPWDNETRQRNDILHGLSPLWPTGTLVLMGDVDEIPRAGSIPPTMPPGMLAMFEQDFYYYNYHTRALGQWFGTRLCRADYLRELTPQGARQRGNMVIKNGGWHFSYQGGAEAIQRKLQSFSHQEYNQPPYTDLDYIQQCIDEGRDLFGRPEMRFEKVLGDDHLPECLRQ